MGKIIPFKNTPPHILVVEDDRTSLDMIVEFIEFRISKNVTGVINAWSAINCLNNSKPIDLVLTDINLAFGRTDVMGMDGIELTGIITRNWDIPVIVMTGYKPETQRDQALSAGASAFFGKPFLMNAMEECMLNLISRNH